MLGDRKENPFTIFVRYNKNNPENTILFFNFTLSIYILLTYTNVSDITILDDSGQKNENRKQ